MDKVIAEAIVEVIQEQGEQAEVYYNYSGRSMFGKETTGIVVQDPMLPLKAVLSDSLEDSPLLKDICEDEDISPLDIDGMRSDSLGFQTIIY